MANGKPRKTPKAQPPTADDNGAGGDSAPGDPDRSAMPATTDSHGDGEGPDGEIRREAYRIFLSRGDGPGDAAADWFAAERLLRDRSGSRANFDTGASPLD